MATSSMMQSILVSPMTRVVNPVRTSGIMRCSYVPRVQRSATVQVRCMAEDGQKKEVGPVEPPTPSPQPIPSPPPKPKVSTKFSDVLAFSGPAPERINGRLAMIGFVAAIAVELSKGQDVFSQISDGGISWFVGTSVVLSLASLIPLFQGVSVESKSGGFMSSDAELWNGRFAMLGLVALAFTEYVIGGALV
ncbi:early light-induced protein 1, chloroplastic [Actinidia eriantha]|uniref:early light-induced protein 1, chloroplastic n=1 Tax=Actinidia eriantha TaxID=165200 RepID=UPI0025873DEA|nr:early light-induced protein 1, chloroplastic [Actinidia eriantha]